MKKLDQLAARAAAHHGLGTPLRITEIFGTGSFFEGVSDCEPGLIILVENSRDGQACERESAFNALCLAGWDEYFRRYKDDTAAAQQAWPARVAAHVAAHPEDNPKDLSHREEEEFWKDDSRRWLVDYFSDPEYQAARNAIPKTMIEPCKWAVQECLARAGTAEPMKLEVRRYYGSAKSFDEDLRQLFSPLTDGEIADVLSTWASKVTWNQVRERTLPRSSEVLRHVLLNGVGRYKNLEVREAPSSWQPGGAGNSMQQMPAGILVWSASEPAVMPSTRFASVYPVAQTAQQRKRRVAGGTATGSDAAAKAPRSKG